MPEDKRARSSLANAALVTALVPIVALPQLIGGVHPHVATGAALFELVALALLVVERFRSHGTLKLSWIGAPLGVGLALTMLEWLPLPRAVVRLLQPVGAANAEWVTSLLSDDARANVRSVLSLDPPETAFAAVRLAGAVALFLVVTETCRRRRARDLAYRVLLASGVAMFLVALGHQLLHVQGTWGRYAMHGAYFYAPMVNPNQLARVLGAIALACAGRAFVVRSRLEILWCAGTSIACGAGVFLTLSRGAMLAFVAAAMVLAFLLWRERGPSDDDDGDDGSHKRAAFVRAAIAQLAVIAAVALGLFLAREMIVTEASSLEHETIETSKLALYRPALSLLEDYGRAGVGNNAFAVAFTAKATPHMFGGGLTFTHVENDVIETLVDHGVVGGSLVLLAVIAVAIALWSSLRTRAVFIPLPALAYLVIGDLFDFALESTAGLYVAALLLALAAAAVVDERAFRAPVNARGALAVAAVLTAIVALTAPSAIREWRRGLDDKIAGAPAEERAATIERAIAAHPADSQFCYLRAVEARAHRDPKLALKWANRALVLSPAHRAAHVEAARALYAEGHVDQAIFEYKAAFEAGAPDARIVRELRLRTKELDKLRAGLPDNVEAASLLADILVGEARLDDAQTVLDHAATLPDANLYIRQRAVEIALQRDDAAGARARLEPQLKAPRVPASLVALLLTAIERQEGLAAAYAEAPRWTNKVSDDKSLLTWQLNAALRLGELNDASADIEKLRRRAADAAAIASLDRQEADLDLRRGNAARALRLLERLAQRQPGDVALQVQVAQMELSLGLGPQARLTLQRIPPSQRTRPEVVQLQASVEDAEQGARERKMRAIIDQGASNK